MKKDNKKKKVVTIVVSILIVLMLVLATSYAYFSTQLAGKDQIVKVGQLELVLNETSEGITLDNAIGISDEDGMGLTPSTFELKNNGNNAVDYTIYLDDNTISDTDIRIDDMYLKYNLNKNGTDSGATLLTTTGTNPNRILDSGTIAGGDTNTYSLNLWITDKVDGNYSGQVFSGKLRVEVSQERAKEASTVLLDNIPEDNLYDDGVDTFITGEDPNNYIWYSGKLWRAVSVNNDAKTVKLVTQWNISAIPYDNDSSAFEGSYMEDWLNDISVDGFLGNLREPEKFIVMDSQWDATMMTDASKPLSTTIVEDAVGLLSAYEYAVSYTGTDSVNGYLNNGLDWWLLTPYSLSNVWIVGNYGEAGNRISTNVYGIRPSINLKADVKIVSGDGTEGNPYRLEGDNDSKLSGTLLNTRYSGEYIRFGVGENNLYRIVSHETEGLTKITSAEPLKENNTFMTIAFDDSDAYNVKYSDVITIGQFLNGQFLTDYIGINYGNMIEDSSTWYLGTVGSGTSYKLAKYIDIGMTEYATSTESKVGLMRVGELMASQFNTFNVNTPYWLLSSYINSLWYVHGDGYLSNGLYSSNLSGIKPALNLKSNVIITSGDGTKESPFQLSV